MNDASQSAEARVANLAQEFSVRHRRGEHPTIEEYEARHPELAPEIRELFPMLCVLEDLGPASQGSSSVAGAPGVAPPQRLGEYRILREIGRGGMGIVYEAEQETLRRRVAIKVLPFQLFQSPHQLERFRIEAQASARLHHTNIVPVFGVGVDQGIHYYVMQLIHGQTLADVLAEVKKLHADPREAAARQESPGENPSTVAARSLFTGPVEGSPAQGRQASSGHNDEAERASPAGGQSAPSASTTSIGKDPRSVYCRSVARIALQVAEGLAYAHREGILHRDIKPSNLLLDLKATVWITDFGLAKVQDSSELTVTGGLVGTLRYMAPERFQGKGDERSDVYGLGVTLYELLTLRPAFPSSDRAEVVKEVTESRPPPPRKIDPSIPRDLETIVLKAISKEPRDRYSSADALAQDLRHFLNYEPVNARRASVTERLWRWCQREPALATLTAVSVLLLLTVAVGSMVYAAHLGVERTRAVERLVTSKLQEGRAWRLSREPGSRKRSLDALREAATPATAREVRNEVIGSLALVELVETDKHEEQGFVWAIDPDVKRSAVVVDRAYIRVYEGVGKGDVIARLRPASGRRVNYCVLSSGGRCLAARSEDNTWVVWDVDRGEQILECKARVEPPSAAFDATSTRFAYLHPDGGLAVREVSPGGEVRRLEAASAPRGLAFDRAGRRLAAAGCGANENIVTIHDLESGALISRLFHPNSVWTVDWHPDGRRVAVGCTDYQVHVWDVEHGQILFRLKAHTAEVRRVYFGDQGRLIASGGWDNRALIWHADTGKLLTEAAGEVLAFSNEDRRLGFSWGERRGELEPGALQVETSVTSYTLR